MTAPLPDVSEAQSTAWPAARASAAGPEIRFYDNEVPDFAEAELERLYQCLMSTIARFDIYEAAPEASTYVVRERVGSDIVRLHKGSVEKIAQRDAVTRLKANVVFSCALKSLRRNGHRSIEIAGFPFRPIQHHACRSNLCQATDLQFLPGFLFFQNVAGLRVGDKVCLRRCCRTNNRCGCKKCEGNDQKST